MRTIEQRIIRPLLNTMDAHPWGWAYIGVGLLMVAWVVLTTVYGNFSGGPVP